MKRQASVKVIVDLLMTVLLMLLMAFELIGRQAHEWIGTAMFVAFVIHHILNRKWTSHLLKGRYTPIRIFQTMLAVLVLICILASMVSGVVMSRYVFDFLPIEGGRSQARIITCWVLTGDCVYVPAPGSPLEHDDGNGGESLWERVGPWPASSRRPWAPPPTAPARRGGRSRPPWAPPPDLAEGGPGLLQGRAATASSTVFSAGVKGVDRCSSSGALRRIQRCGSGSCTG